MPKIAANGIEFNYQIDGRDGAPWITFSNSLATNLALWDQQADHLSGDYRILRYDQRGHGATEATEGPYSFDLLTGDVIALWDVLGIERSHFVGLSLGGTTGIGLAINHADRLISMIASDARCDANDAFRAAWDTRIDLAHSGGMEALAQPTADRWFTEGFRQTQTAAVERIKDMIRGTSVKGFIGCVNALQTTDYRQGLGGIGTPVLFIVGAEDSAVPPDYVKTMHESVGGSQFAVIERAGHISNVENPEPFQRAVDAFLEAQ